jgi:Major tropism determinant N-terminal domain
MATRMQQRRGTAAQWTAANPVLSAGEIGYETDTNKFKIGDGTTSWSSLKYFMNLEDLDLDTEGFIKDDEKGAANGVATLDGSAQIPVNQLANIIQSAPNTLDTLNEIASSITDTNGLVKTAIADAIETAMADEIAARDAAIAVEAASRQTAISAEEDARDAAISAAVDPLTASVADLTNADTALSTSISGLTTDLSTLNTAVTNLTTADVAEDASNTYFTAERAQDAVGSIIVGSAGIVSVYDDEAATITISADATIATATGLSTAISDHNSDTTNVHGITDTAELETQTGAQAKADNAQSAAEDYADGLAVNYDAAGAAAAAQTAAEATAASLYATKVNAAITGSATAENLTITGDLVVQGTTTTVAATNLEVTDSLIYLAAEQFDTDTLDIGIFGAYGDVQTGHFHTGILRDATDGKWKLVSNAPEPTDSHVDFTNANYDTLKLGGVEFADGIQTKQGVPSITPISQKTASYTLSDLSERDSLIEVGSSSATTLTIPADSAVDYPVGTTLDILQTSTGQVTIAGDTGVTVNATPGLKLRTQWSSATLMKRAANTWVVYGDLTA